MNQPLFASQLFFVHPIEHVLLAGMTLLSSSNVMQTFGTRSGAKLVVHQLALLPRLRKLPKVDLKYEVRRLKRRQLHIRRRKMAEAFASHNSRNFWSEVKKVNKKSKGQVCVSSIDGVSGDLSISNLWATKLHDLFSSQDVTERDNLHLRRFKAWVQYF